MALLSPTRANYSPHNKLVKIGAAVTAGADKVISSRAAAARYGMFRIVRPSVSLELSQVSTVEVGLKNGLFFPLP